MRSGAFTLVLLLATLIAAGCGSDDDGPGGGGELTVSAATSLTDAFESYGESFEDATVRLSFAGSDELATQIRGGAKPAVYASADTKLPDQLFKERLIEQPRVFTTNSLVLAVPADESEIDSLDDLDGEGVTIAIGSKSVPVGSYTRTVLGRLADDQSKRILDNVRSQEPNVGGISAKLTQGAVDAGFLYVTDVAATNGRLKAIELPERLQPDVAYAVAIVKGADDRETARMFIDGLLDGPGANALREAGFKPPPAS